MKILHLIERLLGRRAAGWPCACGGDRPDVEYHTTELCTDEEFRYAAVWDRQRPLPATECWTNDDLPLEP